MDYRELGSTGLEVSTLGFGMWPIGGRLAAGDYGVVDDDEAVRAIRRALDLGVTLFDTAPAYGDGRGEEILGQALAGDRDRAVIVTKCGVYWDWAAEAWVTTSTREQILESVQQSLTRLGTDRIDVLLIHVPDPNAAPADAMQALNELRESGTVRFVGVSNFRVDQVESYRAYGPVHVQQIGYHLFDRRIEETMLPTCARLGVGVMAYGTLAHGLLTGTWTADIAFPENDWRALGDVFGLPLFARGNLEQNVAVADRLKAFAEARGKTLPQLSIAWVLRDPAVSVALTGIRSVAEIEDNAAAAGWRLDAAELAEIETIMKDAAGTVGLPEYQLDAAQTAKAE